jgi:2-phosphosulfolactate phosphatase
MNNTLPTIEVCLTPELIDQHDLTGKIAVVVDIFRATSCMITGLAEGVKAIYPVSSVEACLALGADGMVTAGERGGKKIAEFDIGNSPFQYQDGKVTGKNVAITTTNGTLAIEKSKSASQILVGAFLNLSATASYLTDQNQSIVIHCAGWKGTPNLEDTLYAGALLAPLNNAGFQIMGDSAELSLDFYLHNKTDLLSAAKKSDHAHRLSGFGATEDAGFCLQLDHYDGIVGKLEGDKIVKV